jgi:hypothetical protein
MKKDFNLRKFIHTTIREYLNEAYLDKDGNLQDMDYKITSDVLMDDDKFLSFIYEEILNHGEEIPEQLYNLISDNHKKIYREELLTKLYSNIGYSENKSLLNDFIKYDYRRFENAVLKSVEEFPEFFGNTMPFSSVFINTIDEILQGRIIQKFIEVLPYKLFIPKNVFKQFNPNVQQFILKNKKYFK